MKRDIPGIGWVGKEEIGVEYRKNSDHRYHADKQQKHDNNCSQG